MGDIKFNEEYMSVKIYKLINLFEFQQTTRKRAFSNHNSESDENELNMYIGKNDNKNMIDIFTSSFFLYNQFKDVCSLVFNNGNTIIAEIEILNKNKLSIEINSEILIDDSEIKNFIIKNDFSVGDGFLGLIIENDKEKILKLFLESLSDSYFWINKKRSLNISDSKKIKFKKYLEDLYKMKDFYSKEITEKEYKENIVKDNFK
ncbi:hypothetical protein [Staphylococcus phage S6]|nr:hypothetical protein [Staphylococcus phage S6]